VADLVLEPDAILALYTDGLVERPGTDIDEGVEALRATLARAATPRGRPGGAALSAAADLLTAEARQATERPDDIALLLTTRRRPRADGP
jgi:serine phosphatase RsbU (regulator of sigma subunit)